MDRPRGPGEDHPPHRQQPAWSPGLSARKNALTLEFPDNALVAALSGPHAKHLARIEQKLEAGIDMQGNLLAITGERPLA